MIRSGEHERLKAAVHAGLGAFAAVCLTYNVCAWMARREAHLARNGAFYGALVGWELIKVVHHLRAE